MTLIEKIQKLQSGEIKATAELLIEIENELELLLYKPYNHDILSSPAVQSGIDEGDTKRLDDKTELIFNGVSYKTEIAKIAERLEIYSTKKEIALIAAAAMKKGVESNTLMKIKALMGDKEKLRKSFEDFMESRKFDTDNNR